MSLVIDSKQTDSQRMVFKLEGRLDTQTTPRLDAVMDPVLDAGVKTMIFDLAGLEYISSAGLRAVFRAKKALAPAGGTVLVVNLQRQVQKVFDIVKAMPAENVFQGWDELDEYLDRMQEKVLEEEEPS